MNEKTKAPPAPPTPATYAVGPQGRAAAQRTVAVFVAHGMGQQIPFQTLDQVARGLRDYDESIGKPPSGKPSTQAVKHGDQWLSRVELPLDAGNVEAHVYEAYWAPMTQGKITLRDVMSFLAGAGRNGVRNAKGGVFRRWVFGSYEEYPIATRTMIYLIVALAVIGSLVAMNSAIAAVAGATALLGEKPPWLTGGLLGDLTTTFNAVVASMALSAIALLVAVFARKWRWPAAFRTAWAFLTSLVLVKTIFVIVVAGVAIPILFYSHIRRDVGADARMWYAAISQPHADGLDARVAEFLFWVTAIFVAFIVGRWLWRIVRGVARDLVNPEGWWGTVAVAVFFAALVYGAIRIGLGLWGAAGAPVLPSGAALAEVGLVWILLIVASGYIRRVLVEFLGDVAIYVMPYKVDAFNDLRREIRAASYQVAKAVYEMQSGGKALYDRIIVVGHSLGSVIAYDALNQVLREAAAAGPAAADRTHLLLTFGSPLDKTAFIFGLQGNDTSEAREALAATVQPMISGWEFRPRKWINVYSPWDIISGHLGFYDPPREQQKAKEDRHPRAVCNVVDADATTPIVAHTEYWNGRAIYRAIHEAL